MAEEKQEVKTEKAKSPLAGKARPVLSWLKPCDKEENLKMLGNGSTSSDDLKEIIRICKKLGEEAEVALDRQTEIELEKALKEEEALQKRIKELRKAVEDKKKKKD